MRKQRRILQTLFKTSSDKGEILFLLGRLAAWDGRVDDAFDHFEKATKIQSPKCRLLLVAGANVWSKSGESQHFQEAWTRPQYKKALEKAIALDPDHIEARLRLMGYHLNAPGILGGKKEEAQNQADQIKMRDPIRGM